jgi:hypothetical protein
VAEIEAKLGGSSGAGLVIPNPGKFAIQQAFYNSAFTLSNYQNQLNEKKKEYQDMNKLSRVIYKAGFHIYRINILLGQDQ